MVAGRVFCRDLAVSGFWHTVSLCREKPPNFRSSVTDPKPVQNEGGFRIALRASGMTGGGAARVQNDELWFARLCGCFLFDYKVDVAA